MMVIDNKLVVKWVLSVVAHAYNTMHLCMMVAAKQFLVEYSKSGGGFHGPCSSSLALCECAKKSVAGC